MIFKIFVLATDGDSREDGNVFYSDYVIVEAPPNSGLGFDEPELIDALAPERVEIELTVEDWKERVISYGYVVHEPEARVVVVTE